MAASFLAGAAIPPLTSVLRSRWPYLLEQDLELVPSAYALDTVMVEVVFIVGPLLTTIVVATVGPEYALIVSAASVLSARRCCWRACATGPAPSPRRTPARRAGSGRSRRPGCG